MKGSAAPFLRSLALVVSAAPFLRALALVVSAALVLIAARRVAAPAAAMDERPPLLALADARLTAYSRASLVADPNAPDFFSAPLEEQRRYREAQVAAGVAERGGPVPIASVGDVSADGVACRVYEPASRRQSCPTILFAHGGGWVLSSVQTHDELARRVANECGARVVSVEYRLAPEHMFPAALDDLTTAFAWAAKTYGGGIVLAGDSAGGNLAAALAMKLRDGGGEQQPVAQILVYPAVDAACGSDSYAKFATGFGGLTKTKMLRFWELYAGDRKLEPLASPLRAKDLSRLPKALVLTAEFDVLKDDGVAYAAALRAAGVSVEIEDFPGVFHGSANDIMNPVSAEIIKRIAEFFRSI